MKPNQPAVTAEEASKLDIVDVLKMYFETKLSALPRLKYDKNVYTAIESQKVEAVISARAAEHIDLVNGGLLVESYPKIKEMSMEVTGLGSKHRKATWEQKVIDQTATKIRVKRIPREAGYQDCIRGLNLKQPFDLGLAMDWKNKNECLGYGFLILSREAADALLAVPAKILDQDMILEKVRLQ